MNKLEELQKEWEWIITDLQKLKEYDKQILDIIEELKLLIIKNYEQDNKFWVK